MKNEMYFLLAKKVKDTEKSVKMLNAIQSKILSKSQKIYQSKLSKGPKLIKLVHIKNRNLLEWLR